MHINLLHTVCVCIVLCLKCVCVSYISHRRLDGLLYTSLLREVMLILQHHFSRQKQMLSSETRYVISLLHSFSSLSVLFTCLHFISIKNGLTPLEVVIVKRDEWEETDNKERQRRDPYHWYEKRDYEGVIDVLSRYSKEPATLSSHDVSRFNTHIIMLHSPFFHTLFRTLHLLSKTPHPLTSALQLIRTHFLVPLIVK